MLYQRRRGCNPIDYPQNEILFFILNSGKSSAIESIMNNGQNMVFAIRAKRIMYKTGGLFLKPYFGLKDPDITQVLGTEQMEALSNEDDLFYL